MKQIVTILLIVTSIPLFGFNFNKHKKEQDTTVVYYNDLSHRLLIKAGINSSFSNLSIINTRDNRELIIKTLGQVSLAAAVNYKWFGIGVGIGLPPNEKEKNKKGNTSKLDLQFNLYTKKFGGDVFFQKYNGFHLSNPGNTWKSDTLPQLGKMQQFAVGATAFYIFNHNKFSYRAPYVRNTIQVKSAGSWLGGLFFNLDAAAVDGGFVPFDSLLINLRDSFPVYAYSSSSYGLSFGYSYTVVISPSLFFNATLMPGFGLKNVSLETYKFEKGKVVTNAVSSKSGAAGRVMLRLSLGYEKNNFLIGATFHSSQGTIAIEHFEFKPGLGSFKFFIAKRFGQK